MVYPLPSEGAVQNCVLAPTPVELDTSRDVAVSSGPLGELLAPATDLLRRGRSGIVRLPASPSSAPVRVFLQVFVPRPHLVVFGVSSFSVATARLGRFLGFHVTVCDPRAALLTPVRFPDPHELVVEWPHRYLDRIEVGPETVLCVLTHDVKYDIPLLERALVSAAGYVGAIGSRRTDQERRQRLVERGLAEQQLARLRSPIGIDLGGHTAEEVAVSIMAEVVMLRERRGGRPLADTQGRLHGDETVEAPDGLGARVT
jgi:xanthine dehydrogenase accessory factor